MDMIFSLENGIQNLIGEYARMASFPAGTRLFEPGEPCAHFLILYEGLVQVRMVSTSGREIVLYRVGPGETCIMTTACLLAHESYPAEGITETDCRAALLTKIAFDDLLVQSSLFRAFVFREHGKRLRDMMLTLEDVAFQKLDLRLAAFLLRRRVRVLHLTHQAIAAELGTAREVVSRHMKEMEARGWISQQRGSIAILDREALRKFSAVV